MNALALTWLQARFELRTLLRNRSALIFTVMFPIIFLFVFGLGAGGQTTSFRHQTVDSIQFFVPGILVFGVISACYTNLAIRTVTLRDNGVLKRVRGTPLPRASYIGGLITSSAVLAVVLAIFTFVVGLLVFNITFQVRDALAALLSLFLGAATFCALGLAVAAMIPNGDGAPGIVNFLLFPVLFVSDVFYAVNTLPHWIGVLAGIFPIKHFANAMQAAFNAPSGSWGFSWCDYIMLVAWGLVAAVVAVRRFTWESRQRS